MMVRLSRTALQLAAVLVLGLTAGGEAGAQRAQLPHTRADILLERGLWPQAEEAYYAQSRVRPRDPVPRAELGRYLAMKGAVLPGTILIEEALQFGLDSALAERMLGPWRSVLSWRSIATLQADSVIQARPPADSESLFRIPLPRNARAALARGATGAGRYRDTLWVDVVARQIGADSIDSASPRIGIELIEALVPSYDTRSHHLTLHADQHSATRATGERFPVLRDGREVRVLMTSGRTLQLESALAELEPAWWQLDLVHGWLVVRR
jgi:hypothetical protein